MTLASAVILAPAPQAWAQGPSVKRTPAQKRDAEKKAQAAFTGGRYQEAISLLDGLYAEFKEPVYLRNLGRCYQRLKEPDRAITTFEEYLLRAPDLNATERDEIRGFIRDMEALKREMSPATTPLAPAGPPGAYPTPPVGGPAPTTPPPPAVPPMSPPANPGMTGVMPDPGAPQQSPIISTQPDPPPAAASSNVGKWIGIITLGAAVALGAGGGLMLASSWSEYEKAEKKGCLLFACQSDADRVDQRALISKILFAGAGVAAIAGGTLLIISASSSPSPSAGTGLSLALKGAF